MQINKIIFGFVGQIASGKGTAVAYLKKKYCGSTYRFSTVLQEILEKLYLPYTRENLQIISQIIREHFGEETLSQVVAKNVEADANTLIAIDGIRRPGDVKYLRAIPGFVLVHIFADIEKRYERIVGRSEKSDDAQKSFDEFKTDHEREAELKIAEIAREATEEIDNNGNLDELYAQLDALVKKYAR